MKAQSAKAKGRKLQKHVCKRILDTFPYLHSDDVQSRSMGASGEDVMLSEAARQCVPLSFECKSRKAMAIYKDWEQAVANAGDYQPCVVIKQNNKRPLAVIDLDLLMRLMYEKSRSQIFTDLQ